MITYQGLLPDAQYQGLIKEILENGCLKNTRAGKVISVFGKTMRFDLSKGHIPLLTTKKVYVKSVIYELLWFISGNTNIRYLVQNGVHIWVDDAYRHYKDLVGVSNQKTTELNNSGYNCNSLIECDVLPKCEFVQKVLDGEQITLLDKNGEVYIYHYGDMGNIYGAQWRRWLKKDGTFVDQLKNIIDTLKTNPDDRRMILTAWNVGELEDMGLPPCHFCCEFYTAPIEEEYEDGEVVSATTHCKEMFCDCNETRIEKQRVSKRRKLCCLLNCRSQDVMLGTPFNIASYAIFTRMIAQCVGMECGELIWVGGDCHIYANHIDGALEQLSRDAYKYNVPTLQIDSNITDIDSFSFENFHISDYYCYPPIKLPLSVGDTDCNCN